MGRPLKRGCYINRTKRKARYIRVCAGPQRHRYLHALVAEALLGRALRPEETVEHENGDTLNNSFTNLVVVSRAENSRLRWVRARREGNGS